MIPVITYSYIPRSSSAAEGVKPDVFSQYQPTAHGKVWQTIQVKLLERKNLANKQQSVYAKYIFGVSVNIGGQNFGE